MRVEKENFTSYLILLEFYFNKNAPLLVIKHVRVLSYRAVASFTC